MNKYLRFLILTAVLFSSCKKGESVDFAYDYFPLEEGHFVEYDVMEISHDVVLDPQHDTLRYRLKTVIGEDIEDNSGRIAKKYFRYRYDHLTGELIDQRVWTCIIDGGRGEVVEENQRKIRLVFAVKKGKEWDVNAFNPEKKEEVYFGDVNVPATINGFELEKTATVEYDEFISLIDYRRKYEVYARGIGLVERSFKDLRIENFDTLAVQKGTELHYRLINYGKE